VNVIKALLQKGAHIEARTKVLAYIHHDFLPRFTACLMGCLHDPANVQQTSSKFIQNTRRANAGRLLEVCWIV